MQFGATGQFDLAHKRLTHGNIHSGIYGSIDLKLWLIQEEEKSFVFTLECSWGPFSKQHCEVWLEDGRTMKVKVRRSGSNTSTTITLVSLKLNFLLSQGLIPE